MAHVLLANGFDPDLIQARAMLNGLAEEKDVRAGSLLDS
jgi:hypothetical protein